MESNLIWIPLLPFLGFIVNGLFGKKFGPRFVSWIGALAPISAFFVALGVFRTIRENQLYYSLQSVLDGD